MEIKFYQCAQKVVPVLLFQKPLKQNEVHHVYTNS